MGMQLGLCPGGHPVAQIHTAGRKNSAIKIGNLFILMVCHVKQEPGRAGSRSFARVVLQLLRIDFSSRPPREFPALAPILHADADADAGAGTGADTDTDTNTVTALRARPNGLRPGTGPGPGPRPGIKKGRPGTDIECLFRCPPNIN